MNTFGPLLGCFIAAIAIFAGGRGLIRGAASRHWRKVPGTVRKVAIEQITRTGGPDKFLARVDYEYVFDGTQRRQSLHFNANTHRATAAEQAKDYSAGQPVDVFVDELRPDRCSLQQGVDYRHPFVLIIGLLMLAFFLWALFAYGLAPELPDPVRPEF